jgi:hypothetical protein
MSSSVAVPAVVSAVPKFAVQDIVVVPQPEESVAAAMPFVFGITVNGAVPVRVNVTGAIGVLTFTVCVPPLTIAMVGAAGALTVTVAVEEDDCP